MKELVQKIYFKVGIKSDRTKNITKHVLLSFLYKGGSILAGLLLVPLTIGFLDTENYGIWLTLSSFIAWFSFFDIGLGNGLRNKFAEAKAKGEMDLARGYVSSAYFTIGVVCLALILIFGLLNFFIDWTKVFNASPGLQKDLSLLMPIVFGFFCLQLVAKLITTIYTADQHHSMQGKINFYTQTGSLALVWLMTKTSESSLLLFGTIFSIFPVLILIILNFFAFNKRYEIFRPSIKHWKLEYLKDIFGLGFNFFIIQIAALVLFSTDNFLISKLYGPKEVVPYNLAYKYFSLVTMVYTIVVSPYWSSFTEAYVKSDFVWIRKTVSSIQKLWLAIPISLILMLVFSNYFYTLWIGNEVSIPFSLSLIMAIYVILSTFNLVYVNFINGVGKIKVQLITSIISMVINIPMAIFFAKYLGLGTIGIMLSTCICLGYSVVLRPLQYYKLINNTAKGVWNK